MTDLLNGHQPTKSIPHTAVVGAAQKAVPKPGLTKGADAVKKGRTHPKQPHLDTLIHAKIVTHLIHVDEVPDTLFALSQMRDLPEVSFAAIFDDGLIALGCPTALPEALATIAVRATATSPAQSSDAGSVKRIEDVSHRLAKLVDSMAPEEIILNDQYGRAILDRLKALEAKIATPQNDPALTEIRNQLVTLHKHMADIVDPAPALAALQDRFADIANAPMTLPAQTNDLTTAISTGLARIEQTMTELKTLSAQSQKDTQDQGVSHMTDQIARLEQRIHAIAAQSHGGHPQMEKALKTLVRTVQSNLKAHPATDVVAEKIEQLGTAQRTAFSRLETAMTKAVSGMEPALDHLNARAADTENRMSDWQKDLKTLSQHTRAIADSTGQFPSVFATLQSDLTTLANKPAPTLDLSVQEAGFARFSTELGETLSQISDMTSTTEKQTQKTAAQSNEIIATLQTLPKMISTTLRHEVDLEPIQQGLSDIRTAVVALPNDMHLDALASGLAAVSDQITPLNDLQAVEFEGLQSTSKFIVSQLQNLSGDIVGLQNKDTNLDPVKEQLSHVQTQLSDTTVAQDTQLAVLRDGLDGLTRHLGVSPVLNGTQSLTTTAIMPESSLNTLRMEFADLVTKRMQENEAPFTSRHRQS